MESRTLHPEKSVLFGPWGEWQRVYCISCGTPQGLVHNAVKAICVCDECADKFGGIPLTELSPEYIKDTK